MISGWKNVHLSDCLTLGNGKSRPLSHGDIPVYGGNGILDYCDSYNNSDGTIIIGRVGACGSVYISYDKIWISDNALSAKPLKNNDIIFLYYYLLNMGLNQFSEGSSHPLLTHSLLYSLNVSIPEIDEQHAIAAVLSSLDDKIDLLHRQNSTLEAMAEALFRQLFELSTPCSDNKIKLGNLLDISSGKSLNQEAFFQNATYPILGANGKIGTTNQFLYDEKIIYTGRVGTLGNIFVFHGKAWYSDNTLLFTNIKYFYLSYFILKLLHLEDYNVGSTQPLIRQSDIKNIDIVLPNKYAIEKFENNAEEIFAKINHNETQINTLEKLRDVLLPKLMSGEVRVDY